MKPKLCIRCNKPIVDKFKHAKYCKECYILHRKEYMQIYVYNIKYYLNR